MCVYMCICVYVCVCVRMSKIIWLFQSKSTSDAWGASVVHRRRTLIEKAIGCSSPPLWRDPIGARTCVYICVSVCVCVCMCADV